MSITRQPARITAATAATLGLALACSAPPPPPSSGSPAATPIYSKDTGRLEQLVSDRDGDGKLDTRAFMDGTTLQRIEIDRNADGTPDRWEHYHTAANARAQSEVEIARAEEANGSDERITRREFYDRGTVARIEEDINADGRIDKWEHYASGQLVRVDLDLKGAGFPDRRMTYRRDGSVDRVEVDPEGRGNWRLFTPPAS
jgi:hypothetical protein